LELSENRILKGPKVAGVSGAHTGGEPKEIIMVMHLLWGETMYPKIVFQKKGILLLCLDLFIFKQHLPKIQKLPHMMGLDALEL
jgi:hypothetical protein